MTQLLTITDEKLEEYLSIWSKLIERGRWKKDEMEVTLTVDYGSFAFPWLRRYTLKYGEELRELTYEQAVRAKQWLDSLQAVRVS